MNIVFKNLSSDLPAKIVFGKPDDFVTVEPLQETVKSINGNELQFYVKYERDFTFGYKGKITENAKIQEVLTKKITQKAVNSVGNAVLQIANTYSISGLTEKSVITVNDKAHLLLPDGIDAFFYSLPILLYFGQAECLGSNVKVVDSVCFNRPGVISFYKFIYRTVNLHGFIFNIVKYKVQINRHRRISSTAFLTKKFQKLYALPFNERDYQFKPLRVLTDKFLIFIKSKLPKRVYNKLMKKIEVMMGL